MSPGYPLTSSIDEDDLFSTLYFIITIPEPPLPAFLVTVIPPSIPPELPPPPEPVPSTPCVANSL